MRLLLILIINLLLFYLYSYAQIAINMTGSNPHSSAGLDIDLTNKGLLIPRMTTSQRDAIGNPAHSLIIFNTTTNCFEWRNANSGVWVQISCGCVVPTAPVANAASNVLSSSFIANWNSVTGATGYRIDVSLDNTFTSMVSGYSDLNVGNVTSYNVTGLNCNTTYYYRVRAYSTCGASVNSNTITVTTPACPPGGCGSQIWMIANMSVGTMINGVNEQNNENMVEKYCYNDNLANCSTYGGLYQWAEALQAPYNANTTSYTGSWATCDPCGSLGRQGICPLGYHVPTDLEFSRYEWCVDNNISPVGGLSLNYYQTSFGGRGLNNTSAPAHKMKVTSTYNPSWDGSNASGFSALPSGVRGVAGAFDNLNNYTSFFTATELFPFTMASVRFLYSGLYPSYRTSSDKLYGFSVRCIKD